MCDEVRRTRSVSKQICRPRHAPDAKRPPQENHIALKVRKQERHAASPVEGCKLD